MKSRHLAATALVAALALASCSGGSEASDAEGSAATVASDAVEYPPVTNDLAREALVDAEIALVCSSEDFVKCKSMDGEGTFAVMVMTAADLDATFARICANLVPPGATPDPALAVMKVVTDRRSFLVVGDTAMQFPDSVDPEKIRDVLGGEVVSFDVLCAPQG